MRDNYWLEDRLRSIWYSYFSDVDRKNRVKILFKGKWKNKFGHIKKRKDDTEIAINGLFKSLRVPDFIIDLTIAHELVHYMHGFQSPHQKTFNYPHQGGIVRRELVERGFRNLLKKEKYWTKNCWLNIYKELMPYKRLRRRFRFF